MSKIVIAVLTIDSVLSDVAVPALAQQLTVSTHQHRTDRPPQTVLLALYLAMADLRRLNAA